MVDNEKFFNDCCKEIIKILPEDSIILSHSDHDGFSSSVLLNSYFIIEFGRPAKAMFPTQLRGFSEILHEISKIQPETLVIFDAPLTRYKSALESILKETTIINFDHHDILNIVNQRYYDFNPHLKGMDFLNSSGLIWMALTQLEKTFFEDRSWVGGIGAAQDYCLEDNRTIFELLKQQGFIDGLDITSVVNSKLMLMSKIIKAAIKEVGENYTYDCLFDSCLRNSPRSLLFDVKMEKAYQSYKEKFAQSYPNLNASAKCFIRNGIKIKFYDLSGFNLSFISDICEFEKESAVYIAYKDGKVSFRSPFLSYDIRVLAKQIGGGGANPRAAGAKTNLTYYEVIQKVLGIFEQRTLL